jgi:arylsulfatase
MSKQPNILLFFTDMQRHDTIHALGNESIRTPNLDRLLHEGTAFTNCYSPSPVCIPARYAMHYGVHPFRSGLAENVRMPDDNGRSLPAALAGLGYHSAAIGKCHFTPDKAAMRGFAERLIQEECSSSPQADDYCRWLAERGADHDEPHGTRGEMYYVPQVSLHPAAEHPSQWVGERSIDFIRQRRAKGAEQPWFLFSSFIHPHPPFAPPKPWHKLYRAPDMPLPEVPADADSLLVWVNHFQNRYKYRDLGIDQQLLRQMKAYYYATISFVDLQIGRVLAELEEQGELDNTLVLFASDHGEYLGDYDCFGKRGMHDASAKVPLLVRYPRLFAAEQRCSTASSLVDIFPTLINAAGGICASRELDGCDLASIAAGKCPRRFVFSQYNNGKNALYMIADERYKYIWSAADQREFLFDRLVDPLEQRNRSALPGLTEIKKTLKETLLQELKDKCVEKVYVEKDEQLDWMKHPLYDDRYLRDPDARLLFQDHHLQEPSFPDGYQLN